MNKSIQAQYDIAVIGAGAAGSMAAIRAAQLGSKVVLIERNSSIGRKILLTGNGRCNITNAAAIDVFIERFNPKGEFLRTAFLLFSNDDLTHFFSSNGLKLKIENNQKVFPATDKAASVVVVLESCLKKNNIDIIYNTRITDVRKKDTGFFLTSENGLIFIAKKIIIATGGASYKKTGSAGDGFFIAKRLGHAIIPSKPALVPLKTKESWAKSLQGLALNDIRITFDSGNKKFTSDIGEMIFTHFGISGPLLLDISSYVISAIENNRNIKLCIDLNPRINKERLKADIIGKLGRNGNAQIKNILYDMLPKRMADVFLSLLKIMPEKRANQITKNERNCIVDMLKSFPLTVTASLSLDEAMVTEGGVLKKEINPRTMESRIIPGLYFAGEVIEGRAPSGGYNLQQAFSTGYLAGESAAKAHIDYEYTK